MDKRNGKTAFIWILIVLIDLVLVFLNQNTYDSGDSVLHYLYSAQAFDYPKYFMHHWAKPFFVLLSAGFAYWGWWGMQLFNALCILGSSFVLFKLFEKEGMRKWMAVLFSFSAPAFFLVQSSGLTEPLFTFALIAIIYLLRIERVTAAMILLSFLPFIRSEGWIIALLILPYLFNKRMIKKLPWVLLGTLLYGTIGLFYYGDFLWMFHQNPYSGAELKYGSGQWAHYLDQLPYIIGFPLFTLVLLGYYDGFYRLGKGQMQRFELLLVYGVATGYFMAHTIFWAEGLFHSFGLNRVLIVIIPLFIYIAYRGMERVLCAFGFLKARWVMAALTVLVVIFPFTKNKAGLNLPSSIQKEPQQQLIDRIAVYTDSIYGERRVYYDNPYIPMAYDKDIDDLSEALRIGHLKTERIKPESIVLWDSYFSVTDQRTTTEELSARDDLRFVKRFECTACRKRYYIDLYESL